MKTILYILIFIFIVQEALGRTEFITDDLKIGHPHVNSFNQHYDKGVKVVAIDLDEIHHASLELWEVQQFLLKKLLFTPFNTLYPLLEKLLDNPKPSIKKVEKWK